MTPLPWYIAGPLIGLLVPALLLVGGRLFGVSSSLRHACAAALPRVARPSFLRYDWWRAGGWNLLFAVGITLGGALALGDPAAALALAPATAADLAALGLDPAGGYVPAELFSWEALVSPLGLISIVGGGFLVGFGARWAGGCTSGHAISGLAALQGPSLVAVLGFFGGGLLVTHLLLPVLLGS